MTRTATLQDQLEKGGLLDASTITREEAVKWAQDQGITPFVIDCDRARSRSAVLRAVVKAVDFPEFFGGNLDALYDCLCDTTLDQKKGVLLWFHNLHSGDPALAEDSKAIINVCNDAADFAGNNDRYFAFGVLHAGKHPDPEPGVSPTPYSGAELE